MRIRVFEATGWNGEGRNITLVGEVRGGCVDGSLISFVDERGYWFNIRHEDIDPRDRRMVRNELARVIGRELDEDELRDLTGRLD